MRKQSEIEFYLKAYDANIEYKGMFGCKARFKKGELAGCTVIWSCSQGWEHVSIDGKTKTPTWEQMCFIKDIFWNEEEECVQYHPRASEYVNIAPFCLHLWRPIEKYTGALVRPDPRLVM